MLNTTLELAFSKYASFDENLAHVNNWHNQLDTLNKTFLYEKLVKCQQSTSSSSDLSIVLRLSLFSHKIMNIPSTPAELKSQILYSSDRNISYNLRNTTKTTLYLPKTNNHYGELTFKYFFNLFVEKICIKHIKMLFIDFKKHILLNIKSYWKLFLDIFEKSNSSFS